MKRALLVLAVFSFFFSSRVWGQWHEGATVSDEIRVRDTSFQTIVADTSAGTAGYSYSWVFVAGPTFSGPVIRYPITTALTSNVYTLIVADPNNDTTYYYGNAVSDFVFNCNALAHYNWQSANFPYQVVTQDDLTDPGSVSVFVGNSEQYNDNWGLKTNMHIDWGNGHSVNLLAATDSFSQIGGTYDPVHAAGYMYTGVYNVNATYFYSYDTMACPTRVMPKISIHVGGPTAQPVFNGATAYCAGDTLLLSAIDTTTVFHNMHHLADTTGIGNRHYWSSIYENGTTGSTLSFSWYDYHRNLLSQDTILVVNNLKVLDSGNYILKIHEELSGIDAEYVVHVTVGGSTVTMDSLQHPACVAGTGAIYLNCYRANDSVEVSYIGNGGSHIFSGRTNAAGHIVIGGLPVGKYSHIRVQFVGNACPSNSLAGPYLIQSLLQVIVPDTALTACSGGSISLSAYSPVAGATYQWAGPGGFSSTLQHPVISSLTTAASGRYSVSVTSAGCTSSDFTGVHVSVLTSIPATGVIALTDTICGASVYPIPAIGGGIWSTSDTSILQAKPYEGAVNTQMVIGVATGTAIISYSATNACGTAVVSRTIYVKPFLSAPITGPDYLCIGDTATFHPAVTGGIWRYDGQTETIVAGMPYILDVDNASINSAGRVTAIAKGQGAMYYTSYQNGCTIRESRRLRVGVPVVTFIGGASGVYPGATTSLSASVIGAGALPVWASTPDSVAIVNATGMVTSFQTGSATVLYTATNACGSTTNSRGINVTDWINTRIAGIPTPGGIYDNPIFKETDNIAGIDSKVSGPVSVATDAARNVYILEEGGAVRKVNKDGIITTLGGMPGNFGYSGDNGPAIFARLGRHLTKIACDNTGNVYIVDNGNAVIRKIAANGIITTIAGRRAQHGHAGDGGAATAALLFHPYSIAVDVTGNLYITETNGYIRKVTPAGMISTIAGTGFNISGSIIDGTPATAANMGTVLGITIDSAGNLLFSENGYIRKIDAAGNIFTLAGNGTIVADGHTAASMDNVFSGDLESDKKGSIFFFGSYDDYGHTKVKKIDRFGMVTSVAGGGETQVDNGPSANVSYGNYPLINMGETGVEENNGYRPLGGIAVDDSGSVYVADGINNVVRKDGKPALYITSSTDTACQGDAVTFTAQGHNTGRTASYQWMINGVGVGPDSFVYTTSTLLPGDIVSCKVYNAAGGLYLATSNSEAITINPLPDAGTITGTSIVCEGVSIPLTNTVTGGIWSSSNANATVTGGMVTGVSAGTAIISYTAVNGCGTTVDTMEVTVNAIPPSINISGATTACVGVNLTLSGGPLGATWTSSDGCATVAAGLVYGIYPGTTLITSSMANSCGIASDTMTITVIALPGAGLTSGVNVICAGGATTLTNSGGMAGGTWSSSSSAATVAGGVVTGISAGTAIISYSFSNYCGTATDTIEVTINGLPASGTITGADTVCEGNSVTLAESVVGGVWSILTTATGTITSTGIFTAVHEGDADVSYSVTNTCGTSVAYRTLHVISADDCGGSGERTAFNIYPDPNNGSFTIEIPQPGNNARITIMDVTGRTIQTITPQQGELLVPVSLVNMPSGTYMVKLVADGKVYSGKVVLW